MSAPRISLYRELSLYSGWSRRTGVLQTLAGIFGGKLSTKHSLAIFTCEARKHGNRWISLRSIYQQHRIPRSLHCADGDTKMENMRRKESRQKREKKNWQDMKTWIMRSSSEAAVSFFRRNYCSSSVERSWGENQAFTTGPSQPASAFGSRPIQQPLDGRSNLSALRSYDCTRPRRAVMMWLARFLSA